MQFVPHSRMIYAALLILVVLYSGTAVQAQEADATETTSTSSTDTPTTSTTPSAPAVTTTTARTGLPATAQVRITNLAANMSNRMESAINRMQNVINRLEARFDIMDTQGFDTTNARAQLATAQQHIMDAGTSLASIDTSVAAFVGGENPRAAWSNLKVTYTSASESIKAAHTALRATIAAAKISGTATADTASSTDTAEITE